MDPPKISFIDHNSIMVISPTGNMKQLYVPFKVKCIHPIGKFVPHSTLYVEQVSSHKQYKILYRILKDWYPFSYFKIV